jgi:hypothetical protein
LRPALAKGDPAVLSGRVRHESCVTAFGWWSANLVERRCLLVSVASGGHAPESCHWGVGKPFPERFRSRHAPDTPPPTRGSQPRAHQPGSEPEALF